MTVLITGDNIVSGLFRNISEVFKPYNVHRDVDPVPCLPDPVCPDYNRYYQICKSIKSSDNNFYAGTSNNFRFFFKWHLSCFAGFLPYSNLTAYDFGT